jgi:DNA/RNA-binding domain of Phe-tRNA-synthetase-like protein
MKTIPTLSLDPGLEPRSVRAALVWGFKMPGCPRTGTESAYLTALLARVRAAGERFLSLERKTAVRNMLRFGAYKPAGRGKPSSEYLLAAALQNEFPLVNPPVDANNAVSLEWGYPASIFDLELCGPSLLLRRGLPGESYIFNPSGQSIDLQDLLCVCRFDGNIWLPCGNPVKDAMATKITDSTHGVAAVVYAPSSESQADLEAAAASFADLLRSDCGAEESGWEIT